MADPGTAFVPLEDLLAHDRAPEAVVAWRDASVLTWSDFLDGVAGVRASVAELPPGRVALATQDAFAFGVGLLALWSEGRVAVCPPNTQPGAMAALEDVVIATLTDIDTTVPGRPRLSTNLAVPPGSARSADFPRLDPEALALELFTSGTTGRGKAVPKRVRHLSSEVAHLDETFRGIIDGSPTFGSASHQHLYGMLFRVLWPLTSGRPFDARIRLHAEELEAGMAPHAPCVLASVPAHLKRLAERDGLPRLLTHCRAVFSSGGPLDPETARRFEAAMGEAPYELFGSTETGGVAMRRQGDGPTATTDWMPLEAVRVTQDEPDGRMRVHSPFVSLGDGGEGFAMGDRIESLSDGRFRLLGRGDRVLKIGEKRLSLPDMEDQLQAHPWVERAALLAVSQGGERRVAGVVVLTPEGRQALAESSRREVGRALAERLAHDWERVLLPRAWRFVDALPENAMGKVTFEGLEPLFLAGDATP